jgi:hypothetical protein
MMKKQAFGFLTAAGLGLILVLFPTLIFKSSLNNLWVLIGISIFASGFAAFLSYGIVFFSNRIKHGWNFGSAREAHRKLASLFPINKKFNEIIIVAYTSNSAYRMLELFDERNCFVERLRVLLRSPVSLMSGEGKEGAIPNNKTQINNRLSQMGAHLLGDIIRRRLGMDRVHKLEIKFYDSEPVLRGMVIDGKKGFFSIFTKRKDSKAIDYSATNSATLRLSGDGGYEEKILVDFIEWFNLVWEYGSKTYDEEVLDKML